MNQGNIRLYRERGSNYKFVVMLPKDPQIFNSTSFAMLKNESFPSIAAVISSLNSINKKIESEQGTADLEEIGKRISQAQRDEQYALSLPAELFIRRTGILPAPDIYGALDMLSRFPFRIIISAESVEQKAVVDRILEYTGMRHYCEVRVTAADNYQDYVYGLLDEWEEQGIPSKNCGIIMPARYAEAVGKEFDYLYTNGGKVIINKADNWQQLFISDILSDWLFPNPAASDDIIRTVPGRSISGGDEDSLVHLGTELFRQMNMDNIGAAEADDGLSAEAVSVDHNSGRAARSQ
jgi:hypothetical protein